jgi:hypothetical protein
MSGYIDIYLPGNSVITETQNQNEAICNKDGEIYYLHICNNYIVIHDKNWMVLYSLELDNKTVETTVTRNSIQRWYVKNIHPLAIERYISFEKVTGMFDKENKKLKLSNGIEIGMKNI